MSALALMKLYAHENCCCWDEMTCYWASYYGHLNCLKYAHENGCTIDVKDCLIFATVECKEYLESLEKK